MGLGKFRTVVSILLILSLTAPFVGTYTWLQYHKHQTKRAIKWRMIDGMPREELELLKFSKEETQTRLRWEHSREFEFNHQMYDVVEVIAKGDSIFYWCWWDNEETVLNKQLAQLVARALGNDARHNESRNRLLDFLKTLYVDEAEVAKSLLADAVQKQAFYSPIYYSSLSYTPLAPPPERVYCPVFFY